MIMALVEIRKRKKMDAGESKLENKIVKDEVLVVDDEEVGDEEMMHHLRREIEELRVENRNLKEVEEIDAERVRLRRKQNERADKYSKVKTEMRQQQKEHADQLDRQQFMIQMMQDQLEAIQGEPLHRGWI